MKPINYLTYVIMLKGALALFWRMWRRIGGKDIKTRKIKNEATVNSRRN